MKSRKKNSCIEQEKRNALYNKTIRHNKELAEKNTTLAADKDSLFTRLRKANEYINRKRWWNFLFNRKQIIF